jgi:hypothetical protein
MSQESTVLTVEEVSTLLAQAESEQQATFFLTTDDLHERAPVLPYNSAKVFTYAQSFCSAGNDCPDGSFSLDCTHFLCHALFATGLKVTNPTAKCQRALCIRVNDLATAFNNTVGKFSNVKRVGSHAETRRGDFCFIPSWFGLSKEHGMLLSAQASGTGASVYAHTNNRCGQFVNFEGAACVYYRIEDASLSSDLFRGSTTEEVGYIRGLDGMDFPANKGCQAFLGLPNGSEIVLFTDSTSIQSLLETAFALQERATVVYEESGASKRVLQVRFNRGGASVTGQA